jgi:hypothetical protein
MLIQDAITGGEDQWFCTGHHQGVFVLCHKAAFVAGVQVLPLRVNT